MKTLLLMRHAKSSWSDMDRTDHDRPLNDRGKQNALQMGQLLRDRNLVPQKILTSTARRARKTADRLAKQCGYDGEITQLDDLYHAQPTIIRRAITEHADGEQRLLVIGHNPGIADLLMELTGSFEVFPTATIAVVELDLKSWHEISQNTGSRLLRVYRPRELDSV